MYDFVWELSNSVKRFFRNIYESVHEEIIPRIKIALLFPFAKVGIVSAQLSIANILFFHYWGWELENPEKWIEKGVEKNIPFASVLKGHFYRYKARQIEDEESSVEKKMAEEFMENLDVSNYEPNAPCQKECEKIWEEKEKIILRLFSDAIDCYKKAADMNFAAGQFYTFAMYDNYRSILNLKSTGAKYLKLAAENGCPTAQYVFAQKCLEKNDLKNGLFWMKKAAKARKRDWLKPEGYLAEKKDAQEWYRKYKNLLETKKLALSGNPKALYDYSRYLLRDSHKREALYLSHEWHTKAAKAGYPKAMEEEGSFIIHGWVSGTLEDAYLYYSKAYDAGYKMASWGLGDCYYHGWGVERSLEKARYYYRIAKRLGVGINMKALKKMTEEEFEKVDCEQALKWDREFYN